MELHHRWRWVWSEIGVGLEIGVRPRWRCGWSYVEVGFGLVHGWIFHCGLNFQVHVGICWYVEKSGLLLVCWLLFAVVGLS